MLAAADLLVNLTEAQHRLLILGRTGDFTPTPEQLTLVSGFAYMSGRDAWTDLLGDIGVAVTQHGLEESEKERDP